MKNLIFFLLSPMLAVFTPRTNPIPPVYPRDPIDTSQGAITNPAVTQAMDEAQHWLNLTDQGQYGSAWLDSGTLLQDIVTESQWIGAMDEVRAPFGNGVLSRKKVSSQSITQLPHGTKGNFMLIDYRSQFSGNSSAKERVILMTDALGQWRVISYDLKPANR